MVSETPKLSGFQSRARRCHSQHFLLPLWLLVFTCASFCNPAHGHAAGELLHAVSSGNIALAKSLLQASADPNEHDQERWSSLTAAATRGDEELTAALLKAKAQVDWRNDLARTPLMLAAWRGHLGVMHRLLNAGANPNARSKGFWSPLMFAVDGQHVDAVKLLLAHGADPRVKGRLYTSAMECACNYGNGEIIEALVNAGADVNARYRERESTMLGIAAQEGRLEAVETLLRLGAKASPSVYNTPLNNAIHRRNTYDDPNTPRIIALLLKAGARPAQEDLFAAIYLEQSDAKYPITNLLLQAGASLTARDSWGWTALHKAVSNGRAAMVQWLLEQGAEIDALDRSSWSALDLAASKGDANMVEMLLHHGARIEPRGPVNNPHSPLASAAVSGHAAIVRTLVAAGAQAGGIDAARALFLAARKLDVATVDALLEAGADPNFTENGWTPLAIALSDPQPGSELLLAEKPDPERMRAATESITRRFLAVPAFSQAAKTNALIQSSDRQSITIVRLLVEAGADPDAHDKNFGTARENARKNPDLQVKAFLQPLN